MTAEPEITNQSVRERREAALLEIRFRAVVRSGYSAAGAYRKPIPVKMKTMQFAQQWT